MSSDSEEFSDEDYNPDKDVSEAGSEIESDDETDEEDQPEVEKVNGKQPQKRKSLAANGGRSKRAKPTDDPVEESPEKAAAADEDDDEDEKRRADALWADFLGGDEGPANDKPKVERSTKVDIKKPNNSKSNPVKKEEPVEEKKKEPVIIKEIFEFAGEQVVVEKEVKEPPANGSTSKGGLPIASRVGGGLGSVLGALNKKNKISTLEKTKLDWDRFKNREGIAEDLNTFNRGKDGYLERQDFLERTDVRQFEIERSIRQTTRSNR